MLGEVVDLLGAAGNEGTLIGGELTFTKTYHYHALPITGSPVVYQLHQQEENAWEGSYRLEDPPSEEGRVVCKINPVVEDAFGITIGPLERYTP